MNNSLLINRKIESLTDTKFIDHGSALSNANRATMSNFRAQGFRSLNSARVFRVPRFEIIIDNSVPEYVMEIIRLALELLRLPSNWDSYGAPTINPQCIGDLVDLIDQFGVVEMPVPSVVPTSSGRIQIEWHTGGIDLEIEAIGNGRFEFYYFNHETGEELEDDVTDDYSNILSYLSTLQPSDNGSR